MGRPPRPVSHGAALQPAAHGPHPLDPKKNPFAKSSRVPGRNAGRAGLGVVRRGGAGLVAPLGVGAKPLRSVLGRVWAKPASSYVAGLSCKPINGVVQKGHNFKVRSNPCARRVARPRRPLPAVCSRECPQMTHPRGEAPRGGPRRPRPQKAEHDHQQFNVNLCRSHCTRRSRCCRLVLPAPHPRPVHPSPSARPHDPKPVSDPACARDQLARTHPASPRRVVVARSWSPAPARELRTRRCRP